MENYLRKNKDNKNEIIENKYNSLRMNNIINEIS